MPQLSRERDRHLSLMLEIARSLAGSGSMREFLRDSTDALVKHLSVGLARIWTVDSDQQRLELQASSGVSTSTEGEFATIPFGQFLVGHVAATGRPHLTNDLLHDPFIGDPRWVLQYQMAAFAGYPLRANERLVGVLAVFAHQAMSAGTLDLLGAAGSAMAQAIERKRSEDDLARQEAELRLVMDSLPAMVSYVDRNTTYRRVNNAYMKFFGLRKEDIIGRKIEQILGPENYVKSKPAVERVLRGERVCFETSVAGADGKPRSFDVTYTPDTSQAGEVAGFVVCVQDISERKRTEVKLTYSSLSLAALVNASPLPIIALTPGGEITLWNKAAERTFGWEEAEVMGKTLPFIPLDKVEEHLRMRAHDLSGEGFSGLVVRRQRKDGSMMDLSVSSGPVRDQSGNVCGTMCIYIDLTDQAEIRRKIAQSEELRQMAEILGPS